MSKFEELMKRASVHPEDKVRRAVLYIIANTPDLYEEKDKFYNFNENYMKDIREIQDLDFMDSTALVLLKLAYSIFTNNAYKVDFLTVFSYLDLAGYHTVKAVIEMIWDYKEREEVFNPPIPDILN